MKIVLTGHVKEQMNERGISEDDVTNAVKYPEMTKKIEGIYYVQKRTIQGTIEVVYEKQNYIKVITVYPV